MLDIGAFALIDAAADAGFDGVGLRLSGQHAVADLAMLRQHAKDRGMTVADVEVHRITTDTNVDDASALIADAAELGASALLLVSDLADVAATVAQVAAITERCRVHGLRLGLEYMAWTNPCEPTAAVEMAQATGCELVVDLLHHVRVGAGTDELDAIVAAGVLGWVQLCDAAVIDGQIDHAALLHEARHNRLLPGDGSLPLRDLLRHVPVDTVISVEVQNDQLLRTPPLERARLLHDSARRVLAG